MLNKIKRAARSLQKKALQTQGGIFFTFNVG